MVGIFGFERKGIDVVSGNVGMIIIDGFYWGWGYNIKYNGFDEYGGIRATLAIAATPEEDALTLEGETPFGEGKCDA